MIGRTVHRAVRFLFIVIRSERKVDLTTFKKLMFKGQTDWIKNMNKISNEQAEAEAIRTEGGIPYSYPINYYWGEDGVWKLRQF